eukprot:scaffold86126_cov32-Tisochrysis_lutea.AAC.2
MRSASGSSSLNSASQVFCSTRVDSSTASRSRPWRPVGQGTSCRARSSVTRCSCSRTRSPPSITVRSPMPVSGSAAHAAFCRVDGRRSTSHSRSCASSALQAPGNPAAPRNHRRRRPRRDALLGASPASGSMDFSPCNQCPVQCGGSSSVEHLWVTSGPERREELGHEGGAGTREPEERGVLEREAPLWPLSSPASASRQSASQRSRMAASAAEKAERTRQKPCARRFARNAAPLHRSSSTPLPSPSPTQGRERAGRSEGVSRHSPSRGSLLEVWRVEPQDCAP